MVPPREVAGQLLRSLLTAVIRLPKQLKNNSRGAPFDTAKKIPENIKQNDAKGLLVQSYTDSPKRYKTPKPPMTKPSVRGASDFGADLPDRSLAARLLGVDPGKGRRRYTPGRAGACCSFLNGSLHAIYFRKSVSNFILRNFAYISYYLLKKTT